MRRGMALTLVVGVVAAAGCGGGEGADSPLDNALGYLPADAPFAVVLNTETESDQYDAAGDVLGRFDQLAEAGSLFRTVVEDRTGDLGEFERALGNEFVVGSPDARQFVKSPAGEDSPLVGAIELTGEQAAERIAEQEGVERDGEASGAQLYQDDSGNSFAIEGGTLVVANSKQALEAALETRDSDERLDADALEQAMGDIPDDALIRIYLDVGALLRASPDAEDALEVKWVEALRTGGIGFAFADDRMAVDVNLETDPEGLSEDDLPIAAGPQAPRVLDLDAQTRAALRDPGQLLAFVESTGRRVDREELSALVTALPQLERRLDIDLKRDVLSQLRDDLAVAGTADGGFGARVELSDPERFERTLAKLVDELPDLAEGATGEDVRLSEPGRGEDFYELTRADGDRVVFGIVDGSLVLADDARLADRIAAAGVEAVEGLSGSVVVEADAEQLARKAMQEGDIDNLAGLFQLDPSATRPLDRVTGSLEASTERLFGSFEITVDRD